MFEKEAEEYGITNYESCMYDNVKGWDTDRKARERGFKDGAEFGYAQGKEEASGIINELLINGYDESTREKALNFLYPDKEEE